MHKWKLLFCICHSRGAMPRMPPTSCARHRQHVRLDGAFVIYFAVFAQHKSMNRRNRTVKLIGPWLVVEVAPGIVISMRVSLPNIIVHLWLLAAMARVVFLLFARNEQMEYNSRNADLQFKVTRFGGGLAWRQVNLRLFAWHCVNERSWKTECFAIKY